MPTDRIFRYSICGTMFLLSSVFFFLFFGGKIENLERLIAGSNTLIPFAALFFSTPIIGLIVSTATFSLLYKFWRRKIHYNIPNNSELINEICAVYPELNGKYSNNVNDWTIHQIDSFFPYYQTQVREYVKDDHIDYLERRWSAFWTHSNNLGAIAISFIVFCSIAVYHIEQQKCDFTSFKAWGFIFFLAYSVLAVYQASHTMKGARTYEEIWLIQKLKEKKKEKEQIIIVDKRSKSAGQ